MRAQNPTQASTKKKKDYLKSIFHNKKETNTITKTPFSRINV